MHRPLRRSLVVISLTASAFGADSVPGASGALAGHAPAACQAAVLRNGFIIQYLRREDSGPVTRLWLCADGGAGYAEIPSEQIARFEREQVAAPLPPPAPARAPEATANAAPKAPNPIEDSIAKAASRYRIDPDFVASVVKAESGFDPAAVSPKGARGLMQLMPGTAASLGVDNALDPGANVEAGTKYLRQLLDQYNGDAVKALAAYNAGPGRVEQYGGVPPYQETRAYVTRVVEDYNRKKLQKRAHPAAAPAGE